MSAKVRYVRSDGLELTFGDDTFKILKLDGIYSISPEVFTKKKAIGSGAIVTGYRIPERDILCEAEVVDWRTNATQIDITQRFFNPNYTFDVYVTYLGEERYAKGCNLLKISTSNKNQYEPLKISVTMLYADAFFLSVDEFGADIANVEGGFIFPFVSLVRNSTTAKGFLWGLHSFGTTVMLENDGDVETYFRFEITFGGAVLNPTILHGTSYVKILGTFGAGQKMVIDTFQKSVTLNGVNISTQVAKESKWNDLVLKLGTNEIQYNAEDGQQLMEVVVYFNKRYLGV